MCTFYCISAENLDTEVGGQHFSAVFLVSGCVLGQVRRLVTKDRTKDRTKDSSAWAAAITRLVSGAGAGLGSGRSDKSAQH